MWDFDVPPLLAFEMIPPTERFVGIFLFLFLAFMVLEFLLWLNCGVGWLRVYCQISYWAVEGTWLGLFAMRFSCFRWWPWGGSRPVRIRECHTTTATSSAGKIASEQVTILRESSSGRRVKQIASKPKSLAVTVPRDSGDEEKNQSQAQRHYGEKGGKHPWPWWNVPSQRKAVTGLLEGW